MCPRGVLEDLLLKVGLFIFLAGFVILDMEGDRHLHLILGRPSLIIRRALIDVEVDESIMQFQNQHVTYNVFEPMKYSCETNTCFSVNEAYKKAKLYKEKT